MYHGKILLPNEAMYVIAVSDIKSNVVTEAKERQHISRNTGMYVNREFDHILLNVLLNIVVPQCHS